MAPHSTTLAWKVHGWRSLEGCSPWSLIESDTTERLSSSSSVLTRTTGQNVSNQDCPRKYNTFTKLSRHYVQKLLFGLTHEHKLYLKGDKRLFVI